MFLSPFSFLRSFLYSAYTSTILLHNFPKEVCVQFIEGDA
jgi:hypothetical protein